MLQKSLLVTRSKVLALKYLYLPLMLPLLILLLILPSMIPLPPPWFLQRRICHLARVPSSSITATSPPMKRMQPTQHLLVLMTPTSCFTMASTSTCPSWRRHRSTISLGAVISVSSQAGKVDMHHLLRPLNLNVRDATGPKVLGVSCAVFHKVETVDIGVGIVKNAIDRGEAVQVV